MNYYKELVDNLKDEKVIELLKELGADYIVEKDNYIITNTICHNNESSNASHKLYYYKDTHRFYCYTNCHSMSIFTFLKNYYETRGIIYDWGQDIIKVIEDCSHFVFKGPQTKIRENLRNRYQIKKELKALPIINEKVLDCFIKYYLPEWLKEGITKKAMDKYNIRYSISQNKIIIPHYNVDGKLVGIRGRALNEWEIENVGKYMPVKVENKWYSHPLSLNLYGLNLNKENIRKKGICYLFEGEKSILKMESYSNENCAVAVCGSNFNKFTLYLLLKECAPKEIIICFDKEEKDGDKTYFNKLYSLGKKYSNYCNFSFIYDRDNLIGMKDSPIDRGYEIFQKLLNKRVYVI